MGIMFGWYYLPVLLRFFEYYYNSAEYFDINSVKPLFFAIARYLVRIIQSIQCFYLFDFSHEHWKMSHFHDIQLTRVCSILRFHEFIYSKTHYIQNRINKCFADVCTVFAHQLVFLPVDKKMHENWRLIEVINIQFYFEIIQIFHRTMIFLISEATQYPITQNE